MKDESPQDAEAAVERAEQRMEHDVEDLARRNEQLGEQIDETRRDWERKREDSQVPGAPPADPEDADGGAIAGDWEGEGPAANKAGQ